MLNIRFETIGVSECASCGRPSTPRWIVVLFRLFHWSLVDVHETLRPIVITCKRNESICSIEEKANHHCQPLWSQTALSHTNKSGRKQKWMTHDKTSLPLSSLESIGNSGLLTYCHLHHLFFPLFPLLLNPQFIRLIVHDTFHSPYLLSLRQHASYIRVSLGSLLISPRSILFWIHLLMSCTHSRKRMLCSILNVVLVMGSRQWLRYSHRRKWWNWRQRTNWGKVEGRIQWMLSNERIHCNCRGLVEEIDDIWGDEMTSWKDD